MTTDKLAQEVLNKVCEGYLHNVTRNESIKAMHEYAKFYHEEKLKEELIKFAGWFDTFRDIPSNELMTHEQLTDKYLKQRSNV